MTPLEIARRWKQADQRYNDLLNACPETEDLDEHLRDIEATRCTLVHLGWELAHAVLLEPEKACSTCVGIKKDDLAPSHEGSKRCESGSIASGGTRAHCSCDVCF